jgi:prepilin-type N-terminal cleavage/methylation domain-containing protein
VTGNSPKPSNDHGFTLLEMLVVLLITSLIFVLLMEALNQVFHMQTRLETRNEGSIDEELAAVWLRDAVAGLQPDQRLAPHVFRGDAHRIEGITTNPVSAQRGGVPTVISLSIESDRLKGESFLRYEDGETRVTLLSKPIDDMRFRYLGDGGDAFDDWPPHFADAPQIPRLILVEWGRGDRFGQLALAAQGPSMPMPSTAGVFGLSGGNGDSSAVSPAPDTGPMPSAGGPISIGPNPYGLP